MKNVHRNMSDLILKEIYGIYETKKTHKRAKDQMKKYKMPEREICKTYDNLSEDELSGKSNENFYIKNGINKNR